MTYKIRCVKCGISEHKIFLISRTRGVKLKCLSCLRITDRWFNLKKLEKKIELNKKKEDNK